MTSIKAFWRVKYQGLCMQFRYSEYHSFPWHETYTHLDSMPSRAALDPAFQMLVSSQMTRTTCPMSRKRWSQGRNPPTYLLNLARDTDSHSLWANRLIHHTLLAFTPSSCYPRTIAHTARGFSSLSTCALVRLKQMGHATHVLPWTKTNMFEISSSVTLMEYMRRHLSFTMALVASLTLCTGNLLKLTTYVCIRNWLEKKVLSRFISKCYLPCWCSTYPGLTVCCVLGSGMALVSTQCSVLSRKQVKELTIWKDLMKRKNSRRYCSYAWEVHA